LAIFYHWSPDDIDNLTKRQARNYYQLIPELSGIDADEEEDKGVDIDAVLEEAELLGLKPPLR